MELLSNVLDNAIINLIEKTYFGKTTIENKIAVLINTRRNAHGNDKVQDACNKYLTLLYDEKYALAN